MLSKFILIFVICSYMRETFNVNMWKADVNYKTLFIEWQCYIFMPLVQGGCVVATFLWENHLNNMSMLYMLMNMAAKRNVNVNNLVLNIVQHPVLWDTAQSWQLQSCLLLLLKSWSARGASHHPAFTDNCLTISHTC